MTWQFDHSGQHAMTARLRLRHVLVSDGTRTVPGWYVVDTSVRPARTVRGPVSKARAEQLLALLTMGAY